MAKIEFNPLTGKFDLVGSGGGTSYLDGEVEFHGNLPVTLGVPAINSAYLVRKGSGIYFLTRKPAGIWVRELNNGNLDDWKYAGTFSDLYRDANFRIINDTDTSKEIAFSAASIGTGQTRVITVPNKNITLDDAGDPRTPTTHAASHAASGSDPIAPNDIGAQSIFVTEALGTITADVTLVAARAKIYTVTANASGLAINLPTTGIQTGDVVQIRFTSFTGQTLAVKRDGSFYGSSLRNGQQATYIAASTAANSWEEAGNNRMRAGTIETAGGPVVIGKSTSGAGVCTEIGIGTTAGTVAAGDHTHTQLHDRSHGITSTSDHTAGNHKVFYSNGSGEIVELALGDSGKVLQSNGATSAPTWETPASGGTKTYAVFTAEHNQPPSTAFATLDTRNSVACLDFDDTTDESAVFVGIIPEGASLGSGLKIRLHWAATTATSGDVRWDVSLERMTTDLDSDSFDTVGSATTTASGTSGILVVTEITLTTIDSVTAGDGFRLKVTRDADNGSNLDTLSGDCELFLCEVRSAA
jgi:hypothetical protein